MPERFCGRCGQDRGRSFRVAFHRLAGEAVAESLTLDSRLARTLGALLLRPGAATRAYLAGKRASYTSPVKLYLVLSFAFFFAAALTPSTTFQISSEDAPGGGAAILSGEDLRDLRERGAIGAALADRLQRMEGIPAEELRSRLGAGFAESAPKAMFFLVPLLALLLRVFYLRSGFFFAEHLVFSLHAHAVAFLLLLASQLSRRDALGTVAIFVAGLHAALAMHHVYRRSWPGTLARAAAVGFLYLVALGLVLAGVLVVTLLTA